MGNNFNENGFNTKENEDLPKPVDEKKVNLKPYYIATVVMLVLSICSGPNGGFLVHFVSTVVSIVTIVKTVKTNPQFFKKNK